MARAKPPKKQDSRLDPPSDPAASDPAATETIPEDVLLTIRRSTMALLGFGLFASVTLSQPYAAIFAQRGITLPIADTEVGFAGFLVMGPIVLMSIWAYLQINLQRAWRHPVPASAPGWLVLGLYDHPIPALMGWIVQTAMVQALLFAFAFKAEIFPWGPWPLLLGFAGSFAVGLLAVFRRWPKDPQPWLRRGWQNPWLRRVSLSVELFILPLCFFFAGPLLELDKKDMAQAELSSVDLIGLRMSGANLREANLSNARLDRIILDHANLREADLTNANLREADLTQADLTEANLQKADLTNAILHQAQLQQANLQEANLQEANLQEANLTEAILQGANLNQADLTEAFLQEADLFQAKLQKAKLQEADLRKAILQEADLTEAFFWKVNLQEAFLWKAKLQETYLQEADLRKANLGEADLTQAKMQGQD